MYRFKADERVSILAIFSCICSACGDCYVESSERVYMSEAEFLEEVGSEDPQDVCEEICEAHSSVTLLESCSYEGLTEEEFRKFSCEGHFPCR